MQNRMPSSRMSDAVYVNRDKREILLQDSYNSTAVDRILFNATLK